MDIADHLRRGWRKCACRNGGDYEDYEQDRERASVSLYSTITIVLYRDVLRSNNRSHLLVFAFPLLCEFFVKFFLRVLCFC